jgi:deoxycytidylate deaminase
MAKFPCVGCGKDIYDVGEWNVVYLESEPDKPIRYCRPCFLKKYQDGGDIDASKG